MQIPEKCTIKFNPHAGEVFIGAVENLRGDLDFSHVRKLEFIDTDLSKVHSIKFNPNGEIRGLKPKDKLRFALINGTQKIKQGLSKVKQRVIKNDTRTM